MNYEFVDTSGFDITGDIYPLRTAARKDELRGEDLCFIMEAVQQRLNFCRQIKTRNGVSSWSTFDTAQGFGGTPSPYYGMGANRMNNLAGKLKSTSISQGALINSDYGASTAITVAPSEKVIQSVDDTTMGGTASDARDAFLLALGRITSGSMSKVSSDGSISKSYLQDAFNILAATEYGRHLAASIWFYNPSVAYNGIGGLANKVYTSCAKGGSYDYDGFMFTPWGYASQGRTYYSSSEGESYQYSCQWNDVPDGTIAAEITAQAHCSISFWVAVNLSWRLSGTNDHPYKHKNGTVYTQLPLYQQSGNTYKYRYFNRSEIKSMLAKIGVTLQKEDYGKAARNEWYEEKVEVSISGNVSNIVAIFDNHTSWGS